MSHGSRQNVARNALFGFPAGRENIVFQTPGQRPGPVSAQNDTALSRGLQGALHELAALGIRVSLDEFVAERITDPPPSAEVGRAAWARAIFAKHCSKKWSLELLTNLGEIRCPDYSP